MGNIANFSFTAQAPVFSLTTILPGTAVHAVGGDRLEGTFFEGNGIVTSVSRESLEVELFDTFIREFQTVTVTLDDFTAGKTDLSVLTIEDGTGSENTGTIPSDRVAPADVTEVDVVESYDSAVITFTLPTDVDFHHLVLYRDDVMIAPSIIGNTYTDTELYPEQDYSYLVRSVDTIGNASEGFEFDIVTIAEPDFTPPGEVTNLEVSSIGSTTAELIFDAPEDPDFDHVQIFNGQTLVADSITETYYELNSLTASTAYTFTVKAVDASGNTSTGVNISFTTTL
ncbi:fibronectin type III domain-containing protein [Peribacillus frigoritolerans]|uniref:Fibronectin type III domain-containing protein n=1 Tax=Peribacillus castrilensis TaxID=2897690 RepID=A0AAW9NGG4_9BACI|nr:fibronectin type III domain-containing protein [Peribacillus castrilensis]